MLTKILFTGLVIFVVYAFYRFRGRTPGKPVARTQPAKPSGIGRFAAYGFVVVLLIVSGVIFIYQWQQANRVVTIRVIDGSNNNVTITLYGGSETAVAIIRLLSNPRFKIHLIEDDPELCRELAERFPKITVIQGTATSLRLMEEEHVGDSNYFVACTKKDEDNIMTCLQAAKLGADHVQLVINKPDYEDILDHMRLMLGVDAAIAPRVVTVKEVLRLTSEEPYVELANLPGDTVKVIELHVSHDSPVVGKLIKDIVWPTESIIVAILHKFEATVPGPEDTMLGGDRIVAIVSKHQVNDLVKLLT